MGKGIEEGAYNERRSRIVESLEIGFSTRLRGGYVGTVRKEGQTISGETEFVQN